MKTIEQMRAEIDSLNKGMVELLAKRMEVAGEIAEYKKQRGLPVHVPEREKAVIESVKKAAKEKGMDEKAAEDIFLKIIEHTRNSESRRMEEKVKNMKLAVLGPAGTFSHEAALNYDRSAEMIFVNSIWEVFELVEQGKADSGIVPVENSIEGGVGITLDALIETDKKIKHEIIIPIRHCLCGFGEIGEIKEVYSHTQALGQCRNFLHGIGSETPIKTFQTSSTAAAAEDMARLKDRKKACLCSGLAAEIYGLEIIRRDVHDEENNMTRFFVINSADAEPSGNDRTSLVVFPQEDRPGLLYEILEIFSKNKINMTKLESRPSKNKLGEYVFFIDIEGHRMDKLINEALQQLEKDIRKIKVFGSYPKGGFP
jgi:chorismate mutase / prephenate dehydratase